LKVEEIAREFSLPRTTYQEHVRKAESKILHAIAPYIRIYGSKFQEKWHA